MDDDDLWSVIIDCTPTIYNRILTCYMYILTVALVSCTVNQSQSALLSHHSSIYSPSCHPLEEECLLQVTFSLYGNIGQLLVLVGRGGTLGSGSIGHLAVT